MQDDLTAWQLSCCKDLSINRIQLVVQIISTQLSTIQTVNLIEIESF